MWLAIIGCMGLLLWTLYKEWTRPNRQWLTARLIATVITITSLLFQIVPVRYTVSNKINEQAIVLLTEGWDRDRRSNRRQQSQRPPEKYSRKSDPATPAGTKELPHQSPAVRTLSGGWRGSSRCASSILRLAARPRNWTSSQPKSDRSGSR